MNSENNNLEDEVSAEQQQKKSSENIKWRTVVGPWKDVAEFKKVYEWLFGDQYTEETRRKALSQMRVWNLRRGTSCPAAVSATGVIISAQLKDNPQSKFTSEEIQSFYVTALPRFLNFMSSTMQSHNMRTMYQTADALGLNSFVVDLRHICSHEQKLPPLEILRNTAEYCIGWLHDYYWISQLNAMSDVDAANIRRKDKTLFDENISDLFEIYDSALEGYMKGAKNIKTLKRHLHGKRFKRVQEFYLQNKLTDLQSTFNIIVQEMCQLVKRNIAMKDMTEIYVEAFLKMRFFFNLAETHMTDENLISLISVNQTLFRMMAIYSFLEDIFLALIEIAEDPIAETNKRKGASFWAVEIAKGFKAFRKIKLMYKAELDAGTTIVEPHFVNNDMTKISKGTRELLIYSGIDMTRTLIIGDHYSRPWVFAFNREFIQGRVEACNEYSAPILKSILPLTQPELNKYEIETFFALIDCMFGTYDNTNSDTNTDAEATNTVNSDKIYTAQDLLNLLNENENLESTECEETKYGIWRVMPDDEAHNWNTCPLSRLPWE